MAVYFFESAARVPSSSPWMCRVFSLLSGPSGNLAKRVGIKIPAIFALREMYEVDGVWSFSSMRRVWLAFPLKISRSLLRQMEFSRYPSSSSPSLLRLRFSAAPLDSTQEAAVCPQNYAVPCCRISILSAFCCRARHLFTWNNLPT